MTRGERTRLVALACVFAFARNRLPCGPAFAITMAYALFWGIQQADISDGCGAFAAFSQAAPNFTMAC